MGRSGESRTRKAKLPSDVRCRGELRAWIPACAGMTKVTERAASLTALESLPNSCLSGRRSLPWNRMGGPPLLLTNGTGPPHSRRDCPGSPRVRLTWWTAHVIDAQVTIRKAEVPL